MEECGKSTLDTRVKTAMFWLPDAKSISQFALLNKAQNNIAKYILIFF